MMGRKLSVEHEEAWRRLGFCCAPIWVYLMTRSVWTNRYSVDGLCFPGKRSKVQNTSFGVGGGRSDGEHWCEAVGASCRHPHLAKHSRNSKTALRGSLESALRNGVDLIEIANSATYCSGCGGRILRRTLQL